MFVDEVDIQVAAGQGGRGCLSFRREKFVPRGGPDGGDGGNGGSIYLEASTHLNTLVSFRFHRLHNAEAGAHGQGARKTGRRGKSMTLRVPVGTVVFEETEGALEEIGDLARAGQRLMVARGGLGGRGNARFTSSTNRAPRRTEPGEPGQARRLHLHLKLLADVGLVGFPNVGKSTLIARVSAARPRIANYAFTTLTPNLGVVSLSDDRSFVVADVPGLIEGAHTGHGLGDRFLSHLERTRVLVHLVDVSSETGRDTVEDFEVVRQELQMYGADLSHAGGLTSKHHIVAASKVDVLEDQARLVQLEQHVQALDIPLVPISAVTGAGVDRLLELVWSALEAERVAEADDVLAVPE